MPPARKATSAAPDEAQATPIEAEVVDETPAPAGLGQLQATFEAMRKSLKSQLVADIIKPLQNEVGDLTALVTEFAKEPNLADGVAGENELADKLASLEALVSEMARGRVTNASLAALDEALRTELDNQVQDVYRNLKSVNAATSDGAIGVPAAPGAPAILGAIHAVMRDVTFVPKNGEYEGGRSGNYAFRRFDDTAAAIGQAFRKHGVFVQTKTLSRTVTDYDKPYSNGNGSQRWTDVYVEVEYTFTSLVDGTVLTVQSYGQGKDNSDKATGKAMTSCLKTALTQAFMIPTNEPDPDSERPGDVEPPTRQQQHPQDVPYDDYPQDEERATPAPRRQEARSKEELLRAAWQAAKAAKSQQAISAIMVQAAEMKIISELLPDGQPLGAHLKAIRQTLPEA